MLKNLSRQYLRLFIFGTLAGISGTLDVIHGQAVDTLTLLSKPNSTRAIALDAVTFNQEPFSVISQSGLYGSNRRTRIMLLATNLVLQPGEGASAVSAIAEDAAGQRYLLNVEYVGKVPGQDGISQVVVRLSDNLSDDAGDLSLRVGYGGVTSNAVIIRIGSRYALSFDGSPQAVVFGDFFPEGVNLGPFFWEVWAMPAENTGARYMLSDGYGGQHALLFGFSNTTTERRYALYGNVFDGTDSITFASDDGPAAGEWGHFAVGWDGSYITTYFNGVPSGRTAFSGPRRTPGRNYGSGHLFIGGSTHNNFIGRISQVRGYENRNPRQNKNRGESTSSFVPQTIFEPDGSSFLINFLRPAQIITDLATIGRVGGFTSWAGPVPPPQFVVDPAVPNSSLVNSYDPPLRVTGSQRVFDSFSRPNATYAFSGVGLGVTEFGSAGPTAWQFGGPDESSYGPTAFGILSGRAVVLSNGPGIAWVPTGSVTRDLEISADRHPGPWGSGIHTGIAFRVLDGRNFFFAYTGVSETDPFNTRTLTVGYYLNGVRSHLATGVGMPLDWTTLWVVTKRSGEISVYANTAPIWSTSSSVLVHAAGAGLYNDLYGLALTNRWDNFSVSDAP
ncbi:MAG: LamG-like jellyroll fold domain-containing protein [Pyrinomonadaceae bacterium]